MFTGITDPRYGNRMKYMETLSDNNSGFLNAKQAVYTVTVVR